MVIKQPTVFARHGLIIPHTALFLESSNFLFPQITQINEECQELRSRLSTGAVAQEKRRADALESEKVRLGQRMTSLEVELTEIRARADDARNRAESERRTLAQQLTDTQAALSIAEVRSLSKQTLQ